MEETLRLAINHYMIIMSPALGDLLCLAFFVTKFISGLKKEIQWAIRLHKPRTVDAALSLAET